MFVVACAFIRIAMLPNVSVCFLTYSPDFKKLSPENSVENNQLAFSVAEEHLGISSLIKPTEMEKPDRLALVTYLSLFHELFQDSQPFVPPTSSGNDLEVSSKSATAEATKEAKPSRDVKSTHEKPNLSPKMSDTPIKTPLAEKPVEKLATSSQMCVTSSTVPSTSKKESTSAEKSDASSWMSDNHNSTKQSDKSDKKAEKSDKKADKSGKKSDKLDKKAQKLDKETDKSDKKVDKLDKKETDKSDKKADKLDRKAEKLDKETDKSDKKAARSDKKADKLDKKTGKPDDLSASSKQSDKPGKKSDKSDRKQATSVMKSTKDLETSTAENSATTVEGQTASPGETPSKKKKSKLKFRLFSRRNKKKSLATATPSIER